MTWIIIIICLAAIALLYVGWSLRRSKRKLSGTLCRNINSLLEKMHAIEDPKGQLIEADAILEKALGGLGFDGSLAEKLKKAGPRLKNIEDVWKAHKLRNQLVHQAGASVNEMEIRRGVQAIERAIRSLT